MYQLATARPPGPTCVDGGEGPILSLPVFSGSTLLLHALNRPYYAQHGARHRSFDTLALFYFP